MTHGGHGRSHGHDEDDHHPGDLPLQLNPIWQQDNVTLVSVGIDIGSSGAQVAFSRLHLRRLAEDLTTRYTVVRRETLFQSPVAFTPYAGGRRIDGAALGAIIDEAYRQAGRRPHEVDTGVVILTGEALRRENAEQIAQIAAAHGGDFVCASAGHHMEAMLAAYGSGAARVSYDGKSRLLNVDIGGGTAKLALIEHGRVLATAAIHIGGRLLAYDSERRITRLEPGGRRHAARAGLEWSVGDVVSAEALDRVAESMADALLAAITTWPLPEQVRSLFLTDPIGDLSGAGTRDGAGPSGVDGVMFSGGVAEHVYGRETRDFGDLGARLGEAVRRRADAGGLPAPLLPAGECIRATVLGASEYSVQLSGNTCCISHPEALLPRRNLQVVRPEYELGETVDPEAIASAIRRRLVQFDLHGAEDDFVLALGWDGAPAYQRILGLAEGVRRGLAERVAARRPIYLVLDGDVALTLGSLLRDELQAPCDLMVIDGVRLADFDYIDLGRLRMPSRTVLVNVKSLLFSADAPT